jgi:regulator of RNase E activity RraA
MNSDPLHRSYLDLSTPHVADACMRLGVPVRSAPAATHPLWVGTHFAGRAVPTRHYGSVDIFLEAIDSSDPGDVLVVDNSGRDDEACVGDLIALEARQAGLAGIVIWGYHRDSAELGTIRLPIVSLGAFPVGPQRLEPRDQDALTQASVGGHTITHNDFVLGDDDGTLFIPLADAEAVAAAAAAIRETERNQAALMLHGTPFRTQAHLAAYLTARATNNVLTFREHLRNHGAEIEE